MFAHPMRPSRCAGSLQAVQAMPSGEMPTNSRPFPGTGTRKPQLAGSGGKWFGCDFLVMHAQAGKLPLTIPRSEASSACSLRPELI